MINTEIYKNRKAIIGIVGLGYVGLPLMLGYVKENFKVIGFDVDKKKVDALSKGESYIEHISSSEIKSANSNGFEATTDMSRISEVDAILICVPTPLDKFREPDLSFVLDTTNAIAPFFRKGQVMSLESTTWPGTTDEKLKPIVEKQGFTVGEDFFLVYSPEREDPGRTNYTTTTTPKVCGGCTPSCMKMGMALYDQVIKTVVPVSSTRAAEMTKLLENIHRAVNIGLVNEMKIVADKMNIDIHEVIRAAATKPFGFTPYFPGPGIGGHCIPIDPFYLTWKAREYGVHTKFIELAGEINSSMPDYVVDKVINGLNNQKKSLNGSKVLVLGIAYKQDIDDMRESPSVFLMEKLEEKGATVNYSDPHVPVFPKMREHNFDLSSVELTSETIKEYDCIILATAHKKFDYEMMLKNAKLLVDTRGKYKEPTPNLIKA